VDSSATTGLPASMAAFTSGDTLRYFSRFMLGSSLCVLHNACNGIRGDEGTYGAVRAGADRRGGQSMQRHFAQRTARLPRAGGGGKKCVTAAGGVDDRTGEARQNTAHATIVEIVTPGTQRDEHILQPQVKESL